MAQVDRVTATDAGLRPRSPAVFITTFDYDFAVSGSAGGGIDVSKGTVPVGARVIGGWYEVLTTFTSAADSATIALSLVGDDDLVTAIAINDASNPWDVDLTKRRPLKGISANITVEVIVGITSAVQTLTAGKLFGAVEWIFPDFVST